jgi:alkanesulfonate monooxygenase SsuD/methylene tetrahydromethanopterin reductase-like flavin-dependent oxidoreductase (luciferase family)
VMHAYRDALARHGRETVLGTDLIIGFSVYIAETEQKAIAEARLYFEENMKMFGPLGFVRGLTEEQLSALADPRRARSAGLPTLEQAVAAGSWLVGPPEVIIEKIQAIQERYPGLEEINIGSVIGTPQRVICEQLEIFATEVMPAFKHEVKVAAPAD